LHEQPHSQRQRREKHRQKKKVGCVCRRKDQHEVFHDKPETGDRQKSAEKPGKVARSIDQVPAENGGDAVEHHEYPSATSIQLEREQRESIQLIGGKGLEIGGASQDERRCVVKELRDSEEHGGYEPEKCGEKGEILADGPEQHVKHQRQRNVTHGLHEVDGEAEAEQRVKITDVFRCGGSVG